MTRTEFGAGLLTCAEMAPHQNTAYCAPHEEVQVVLDPRFGRGLPVIAANRVPVRTLLDLSAAGESAEAVAYEYDMEPGQVTALCQGVMSTAKRLLDAIRQCEPGSTAPLLDVLPATFPWVRALPDSDLSMFAGELMDTVRAADSADDGAPVAQMLTAWRHTAEVYAGPPLLAALRRGHAEAHPLPPGEAPTARKGQIAHPALK